MQMITPLSRFTREFVSPSTAFAAAGVFVLPHGLGVVPKIVSLDLVCAVAEHGYAVGDVLAMPLGAGPGVNEGVRIFRTAVDVNIRFGSAANVFTILNRATGASAAITPANWTFVARAFA